MQLVGRDLQTSQEPASNALLLYEKLLLLIALRGNSGEAEWGRGRPITGVPFCGDFRAILPISARVLLLDIVIYRLLIVVDEETPSQHCPLSTFCVSSVG